MAREEFIRDVWRAHRQFFPPQIQTDSSRSDAHAWARALLNADLWLTPKSVEAFDPVDFADLPPALRNRLGQAVDRFRQVAATVAPDGPATNEQAQLARGHLEELISS